MTADRFLIEMKRDPQTIAFHEGSVLPHWEVSDGRYFVTIRQAGSLPDPVAERLRERARRQGEGIETTRSIFADIEQVLDQNHSTGDLTRPVIADMLREAIAYRDFHDEWEMIEYVLMPNHLHLFFRLCEGRLMKTLTGFKRWTGRQAAEHLNRKGEQFWQREWFDHWSRSPREDERITEYIRHNPVKAGLVETPDQWPYGSWSGEPSTLQ
jgi:REP element-mobilizing transposase RayT